MTSTKIVQFSRLPQPPPCPSTSKILPPPGLGRPISNKPLPPNDNQSIKRKHNPMMTIIFYQVLPSGRLSFSVSTHQSCLAFP